MPADHDGMVIGVQRSSYNPDSRRCIMPRGPETTGRQRARMRGLAQKVQDIGTSDKVLDAVEAARLDPAKWNQLKADPQAYLRAEGASIPRNVKVDFKDGNSWRVCFYYYYWYYRIQYCYYVS